MGQMSNWLENALIDALFRGGSFTAPSQLYLALCTAPPVDASTGATITEVPSAFAYVRQSLAVSLVNWAGTQGPGTTVASNGTSGQTSNNGPITFPTATGAWGTVTSIAICDSATWHAGNVLFYADLATAKAITNGDTFSIDIAQLTVQIDS
jgi:hypothetical protein